MGGIEEMNSKFIFDLMYQMAKAGNAVEANVNNIVDGEKSGLTVTHDMMNEFISGDEKAKKYDNHKPDYSLVPKEAIDAIARVMTFGAYKYGRHNWRAGLEYSRLIAACMRHITAFNEGEDNDPESGDNHLAHALVCLAFLITEYDQKIGKDDRYKK